MRFCGKHSTNNHLIACIALAAAVLLTTASSQDAHAMSPDFEAGTFFPTEASAMIRLTTLFGGNARAEPGATLTLQAGFLGRGHQLSSLRPGGGYSPSLVQMGVTLSGEPVMRFAGLDLTDTGPQRLNAESGSDNRAAWLVLGGVVILGTALGVYSMLQDECCNKEYC